MKLNLGCGNNLIPGYVNIDKYDRAADVVMPMQNLEYEDNSVEEIVIYQALEHTGWFETPAILANCYRMLQLGGKLIIEVPDMEVIAQGILRDGLTQKWQDNIYGGYHRPWDKGRYTDWEFNANSIHYQAFTWASLSKALREAGFYLVRKREMAEKHPDYHYEENLSVEAIK